MSKNPSNFTQNTKDVLAKRAGQKCSNPNCGRSTSIAHTNDNKAVMLGEAAHIFGRKDGSKRYDPNMIPEQRGDIANGLWLCRTCHKLIDTDEIKYKPAILFKWKSDHEKENKDQAISKRSVVNSQEIPVLDLHHTVGKTGGPKGHFITLTVINKSNFYAQDCTFWMEGFGFRHDFSLASGFCLEKNGKIDFKIKLNINETGKPLKIIKDLEFIMSYSNIYGSNFISKRKLNQNPVKTNIYNELNLGQFSPPELAIDTKVKFKKIERIASSGDGSDAIFVFDHKDKEQTVKIRISRTLLATWDFQKEQEVTNALFKLGKIKITNMIELNSIDNYIFTSFDFSKSIQTGYDGFKKACALLE